MVKRFTHKVSLFFQKHRVFYVLASKSIWAFEKSSGKLSILSSYLGNFTYVKLSLEKENFNKEREPILLNRTLLESIIPHLLYADVPLKMRKKMGGDRLRFSKHG